jgi:hypothetical protein
MPRPSFTAAEQFMVNRILDPSGNVLLFEAAYLVPSAALVVFGFVYAAPAAFAAAFAIIAAFRVWQLASDRTGLPVLREVIRKYERACEDSPHSSGAG